MSRASPSAPRDRRWALQRALAEGAWRACDRLEMPSTKQIESSTLDFPEPLRPVMALNCGSKSVMTVRVAYDLKPSRTISTMCIGETSGGGGGGRASRRPAGSNNRSE